MGYSFRLTASVLLYAPSHRQDSTYHGLCYTSGGALAGTRNSSMGPPHEGLIQWLIAPLVNTLTTELHLAPPSLVGSRCSSVVERLIMVQWVIRSIPHGGPIELFPASAPQLVNKGYGMCYLVCGMLHTKEPLLLIGKSSPCGMSRFPLLLNGPLPYVWRHITVNKMCWVCR